MSHNLDLFMLTPGFCLQPANKKNKFAINYELSEKNCYSLACFQEKFCNKDWRHAYRVYIIKIMYSRVVNLYKKKFECIKQLHNPRYHCIRQKRKPAKFHWCL